MVTRAQTLVAMILSGGLAHRQPRLELVRLELELESR